MTTEKDHVIELYRSEARLRLGIGLGADDRARLAAALEWILRGGDLRSIVSPEDARVEAVGASVGGSHGDPLVAATVRHVCSEPPSKERRGEGENKRARRRQLPRLPKEGRIPEPNDFILVIGAFTEWYYSGWSASKEHMWSEITSGLSKSVLVGPRAALEIIGSLTRGSGTAYHQVLRVLRGRHDSDS